VEYLFPSKRQACTDVPVQHTEVINTTPHADSTVDGPCEGQASRRQKRKGQSDPPTKPMVVDKFHQAERWVRRLNKEEPTIKRTCLLHLTNQLPYMR